MPQQEDVATDVAKLQLVFYGNKELGIEGVIARMERLEEHARRAEAAANKQRWMAAGVLLGLAVNGVTLATLLRLSAVVIAGGAAP